MRVQPHLPSSPLTATVMDRPGSAWWAWRAANNPAPPEPRIRMSVESSRTRPCQLGRDDKNDERDTDRVVERLGHEEQQPGDKKGKTLPQCSLSEQPAFGGTRERGQRNGREHGDFYDAEP